jgi:hypothetical protein
MEDEEEDLEEVRKTAEKKAIQRKPKAPEPEEEDEEEEEEPKPKKKAAKKPEPEPEEEEEEEDVCVACQGTGKNSKGGECKICQGSGEKPKAKPENKAGVKKCPFGHKFGTDCEKFDTCDDCDLWDECIDAKGK